MATGQHNGHHSVPAALPRVVVAAAMMVVCGETLAQSYKTLPFDRSAKNENRPTVGRILKGQIPLSGNEAAFNSYFTNVFAEMTQLELLGRLSSMRDGLLRDIRSTESPELLQQVNRRTLAAMHTLCTDNFHPATRYNAALIIGWLDSRLSTGFGQSAEPPVPYADALPVLLGFLGDANLPDAVKVGGLLGAMRHARYGLPAERRAEAISLLVAMLQEEQPPGERTEEGHTWIRRRAADVLGAIGDPGTQDEAFTALANSLTDRKTSLALRCSAANAMGQLKFDAAKKKPADPILIQRLGELALDSMDRELETARKRLDRQFDPALRGNEEQGTSIFGGPSELGTQTPSQPGFPRRQLAYQMACVHAGLSAVGGLADEKSKPLADQLLGSIGEVRQLLERKDQSDQQLVQQVGTIRGKLGEHIAQMQTAFGEGNGGPGPTNTAPTDSLGTTDALTDVDRR
jgi:hypothetical protein